jgi:hypothetical protein
MAHASSPIFVSSLLLEPNRWNGKGPLLNVAEWIEPIAESGFNGFELWMKHLTLASRSDWEAIKAEALAHQAEIPMLYAQLPIDSSDKGRLQRETFLDACDFFRPKAVRFHVGEPLSPDGYLSKLGARLEKAAEVVRDIHRDTAMVFECQLYPFRKDEATQALSALRTGASREVTLAIRPFEMTSDELTAAFALGDGTVSHFGIRAKQGKEYVGLVDAPEKCRAVLMQARKLGFIGPWILETTHGVGTKNEDVVDLFDAAEKDLNFLQEIFSA